MEIFIIDFFSRFFLSLWMFLSLLNCSLSFPLSCDRLSQLIVTTRRLTWTIINLFCFVCDYVSVCLYVTYYYYYCCCPITGQTLFPACGGVSVWFVVLTCVSLCCSINISETKMAQNQFWFKPLAYIRFHIHLIYNISLVFSDRHFVLLQYHRHYTGSLKSGTFIFVTPLRPPISRPL